MNNIIYYIYDDWLQGYQLKQSWWQRLKGRLTNVYEITVICPGVIDERTYRLHPESYKNTYNNMQFSYVKMFERPK